MEGLSLKSRPMKIYLGSLILVMGMPLSLFSQKIKELPPPPLEEVVEDTRRSRPCIKVKSTKTRQTHFPFNKTDSIKILSYVSYMESKNPKMVVAELVIAEGLRKIVTSEIKEQILLSESQTDSLFSIFYDSQNGRFLSKTFCWNPRHCIVFYQGKKVLALVEICFSCVNLNYGPNIDFGDLCEDKFIQLRTFFKQIGIQYKIKVNDY
jgi:hypothetical protein